MKADNMFKKLGYTKQYENENIYYYKDMECKDSYIFFYTGRKLYSKVECYHDAGRFSSGTNEQLRTAKTNLENSINRLTQAVKSQQQGNKIAPGQFTERLQINQDSLRSVKQQYQELKREYKKRKLKF